MTLSLDAQRRAASAITERQLRVFAGPPERFVTAAEYVAGEPVELPIEATTTAAVVFGLEPIDITLDDAGGFANVENVLNLQSPRGSTWFKYLSIDGNTLEDCTLIYGVPRHDTGAKINQWVELTGRNYLSGISGDDGWDGNVTVDWEWGLSGEHYDSDLMPKDATILIMQSVKGKAVDFDAWSDWVVTALGYTRNWDSTGDAKRRRRWSCTVRSISTYMDTFEVPPLVFGRVNLAAGQPVTASDNLANPLDLLDLNAPEWVTGIGTTDADKLTDGSVDSGAYVSAVAPSQTPEAEAATTHVVIQEVYRDGSFWWFKLLLPAASPFYNPQGVDLSNFAITNKQTVFVNSNNNPFPVGHPCEGHNHPKEIKAGAGNYGRLNGITLSENQSEAIITSNRNRFYERYHTSKPVWGIGELSGFGNDGLAGRNMTLAENDWIQIRGPENNGQQPQFIWDMVVFGTHTGTPWWNNTGDACHNGAEWDGSPVANPSEGNSIRRSLVANDATESADDWIEEEFPNPSDRRTDTDPVHQSVEMPDIPTVLAESITNTDPGEDDELPLLNGDYLRPTVGNTLVVRIDTERLLLQQLAGGEWVVVTRGYDSTTPASHAAATPILYEYDDEFIRLPWVGEVELRRWERFDSVAIPSGHQLFPRVPGVWEIWGTREANPLYPGDENYRLDWIGEKALVLNDVANDPSAFNQSERIVPQPLKHVMVVGKRMFRDNTYWMCNEMRVWRAGLSNASSQYVGIGGVVYRYLRMLLPADRIIIDEDVFSNTSADITIQGGALGKIISDLAVQYAFIIRFTRDNKVHIKRNPFHPRAIRSDFDIEVNPQMIAGTLSPQRANNPSRLGNQYVVNIHDTDALKVFTGVYPPSAPFGEIRTIDITMKAGSQDAANQIAQMYYLADPQISRQIELKIVGVLPEAEPLQRHLVFDYTDDAAFNGRWVDCLVTNVHFEGTDKGGYESLSYQEWRQA